MTSTGLCSDDAMPHRGMRRRHRSATEPNHPAQSAGDACLRIGKGDPFRLDAVTSDNRPAAGNRPGSLAARPTADYRGPLRPISHAPRPPSAARIFIPRDAAPLNVDPHRPTHFLLSHSTRSIRKPSRPRIRVPSLCNPMRLPSVFDNAERTPSVPRASGSLYPVRCPGRRAGRPFADL